VATGRDGISTVVSGVGSVGACCRIVGWTCCWIGDWTVCWIGGGAGLAEFGDAKVTDAELGPAFGPALGPALGRLSIGGGCDPIVAVGRGPLPADRGVSGVVRLALLLARAARMRAKTAS
jgi:hypothetical protein